MAIGDNNPTYGYQYRPVSNAEYSTNDSISTRAVLDIGRCMNNYKGRVLSPIICDSWPNDTVDSEASTTEDVILRWSQRWVSSGLGRIYWAASGKLLATPSANNCTWRLYAHKELYKGPDSPIDKDLLGPNTNGAIVFSSDTNRVTTDKFILPQISFQGGGIFGGMYYFTLTAQNTDLSIRSSLNMLNATPFVAD